jgi:hypothetical protein
VNEFAHALVFGVKLVEGGIANPIARLMILRWWVHSRHNVIGGAELGQHGFDRAPGSFMGFDKNKTVFMANDHGAS